MDYFDLWIKEQSFSICIKLMKSWRGEVEEKNNSIGNLLRLMSHDISNSLTLILTSAFVQLKKESDKESENYKSWKKVDRASQNIANILNKVREMQAVESGKMKLDLNPVDLHEVIKNAKFTFQDKLREKDINLNIEIPENISKVMAEEVSLTHQVVNNILSNAIKFSEEGSEINIYAKEKSKSVDFVIRDHGIGMSKDLASRIFKEGEKTSREGLKGEKGTGFGMPLVKTFVNHYGGTVDVFSVEKQENRDSGTKFLINLNKPMGLKNV